jgi:hydrogenase-4 component F
VALIAVPLIPLAAVLLSLLPLGKRFAPAVTLAAAVAAFALAIADALRVVAESKVVAVPGWVELDGLGAAVVLLATLVGATAALFSWGYIAAHEHEPRRVRSYWAHFNLFVFSLMLVPILAEPALAWIGIEFTAVFSVLLVAFDNSHAALEAAWKYIALMFMGAAIALLGFLILFWAQEQAGGGHYSWEGLRAVAPHMSPVLVKAAFLLILVGFGTKVGFVPLHTWLPDAHSQAPSPVCALLSGVKTTTALYCILRLVPLLAVDRLQIWMQVIGLISAGVAAFLLLQVHDYKRLFAYSTVEHMGIIFFAAGLGMPGGHYGAVLQMVSHSVTKSFCFFAAGAVLLVLGTREIAAIRGLIRTSPAAGAALLFGALAIGGAPPFAVFLSEFSILRAGLEQRHYATTGLLAVFITVAFFGILLHVNRMVFGLPSSPPAESPGPAHGALPFACVLTLIIAAIPIFVLGVYQPAPLHELLVLAASNLAPLPSP